MSGHVTGFSRRTFVTGAAIFSAMIVANPQKALAETAAEKQAEADAARTQLVSLQAELEQATNDYYGALDEQQAAQDSMDAEQAKIDEANAQIEKLQARLSTRAKEMYRTGPSSYLDFLLGASSFEEFTTNWDMLSNLNEQDASMVSSMKTLREERQAAYDEFARQEKIAEEKANVAAEAKAQADARVAEATTIVSQLDDEARELLEQEQAAAAIAAAAEAAAAAAAANNNAGTSGGGSDNSYDNGGSYDSGDSGYSNGGSAGSYDSVVGYAVSKIGCPYVWGAEGPDAFDCSGLVRWAYLQVGISLPHQTESLYACAVNRVPVSQARPGDVLYRYGHVGIAEAYGGVPYVHAPTFGAYVRDTDGLSWSGFTCALQFA